MNIWGKFKSHNASSISILLITILFQALAYLFIKPHIYQSDDIFYVNNALAIMKGKFELIPSVFSQRIGVYLPVSLSFIIFGVNVYSSTIYLLLSAIFSTILIFFIGNKIGTGLGAISALLFAINPLTVSLTVDLLPDIFCSTLILLAIYFLFNNIIEKELRHQKLYGVLFSFFLSLSFFVKEYLVFYLPFILYVGIKYYKSNYKFWNAFIITSVILIILIGTFYKLETGSFFYRLTAIESEHNSSVWSFLYASSHTILDRTIFGLYGFFLKNYEFTALIIFSVSVIFLRVRDIKDESIKFWIYNFIILFITFQYGSTSLKSYNPLPLQPRMFICLMPSLSILSAYCIKELSNIESNKLIYMLMNIVLIIALINLPKYYLSEINFFYYLIVFTALFVSFFSNNSQLNVILLTFALISSSIVLLSFMFRVSYYYLIYDNIIFSLIVFLALFVTLLSRKPQLRIILLMLPTIFIFLYLISNQKSLNDNTKDLYDNYISKIPENSVVVMDKRSIIASQYYNINNTNNLIFMEWDEIAKDSLENKNFTKVYLFIDFNKVRFLNKANKTYIPKFINKMPSDWTIIKEYRYSYGEHIGLYKIDSLEGLRKSY